MTIADAKYGYVEIATDGVSTEFNFDFRCDNVSWLDVRHITAAGTRTDLAISDDYTAALTGGTGLLGGVVTISPAPAIGGKIRIARVRGPEQQTQLVDATVFPSDDVERALDVAEMSVGDAHRRLDGALRGGPGDDFAELPPKALGLDRMVYFDAAGNPQWGVEYQAIVDWLGLEGLAANVVIQGGLRWQHQYALGTEDWNADRDSGFYHMSSGAANAPASGAWYFRQTNHTNSAFAEQHAVRATSTLQMWTRRKLSGTWETWVQTWPASAVSATLPAAIAYFASKTAAEGQTLDGNVTMVKTECYSDPGDGGGWNYIPETPTSVRSVLIENIDLSSELVNGAEFDGVTLATGNYAIVAGQDDKSENGIYVVAASGAASRLAAFDTWNELIGQTFLVTEGDYFADSLWHCNSTAGGVIDVDDILIDQEFGFITFAGGIYGRIDVGSGPPAEVFGAVGDGKEVEDPGTAFTNGNGLMYVGTDNREPLRQWINWCASKSMPAIGRLRGKYRVADDLGVKLGSGGASAGPSRLKATLDGVDVLDRAEWADVGIYLEAGRSYDIRNIEFLMDEDIASRITADDNEVSSAWQSTGMIWTKWTVDIGFKIPEIVFRNCTFRGRWSHAPGGVQDHPNGRGLAFIRPHSVANFEMHQCRCYDQRDKIRGDYIGRYRERDQISERNSQGVIALSRCWDVLVDGSTAFYTDDDVYDFRASSGYTHDEEEILGPRSYGITIQNCYFRGTENLACSNAAVLKITGCIFVLAKGIFAGGDAQGSSVHWNYVITENLFFDTLARTNNSVIPPSELQDGIDDGCIAVRGSDIIASVGGDGATAPTKYKGANDAVLPPWDKSTNSGQRGSMWVPNIDTDSYWNGQASYSLVIANNIMRRTLPPTAKYSNWQIGLKYNAEGFFDPEVTDQHFAGRGIVMNASWHNFVISNNSISDTAGYGIYFNTGSGDKIAGSAQTATDRDEYFRNGLVIGNVITNVCGVANDGAGIGKDRSTTTIDDWDIAFVNNRINVDPYFKSARRTDTPLDGTWSELGITPDAAAIYWPNCTGCSFEGNDFQNCLHVIAGYTDWDDYRDRSRFFNNTLRCDPAAVGDGAAGWNESNKGIGYCPSPGPGFKYIIWGSDPGTAGTWNHQISICREESATVPTAGKYPAGHFCAYNGPAALTTGHVLLGWRRRDTGSGHTVTVPADANDNWFPVYGATAAA